MNSNMKKHGLACLIIACFAAAPALAEDGDSAITAELSYIAESVRNFSGGLQKGVKNEAAGTLAATVDLEKAAGWSGATAYVEFIVNHGRDPSGSLIGDFQTASNIADGNRTRLQQAWIEQRFLDDMVAVLVGAHDLNSEFYVSEYGGLFTNSSFGIGPEISGNVGTSLWPEAGLASRVAIQLDDQASFRVAGYDGDPATRGLSAAEGYVYIAEAAYATAGGAYKIGAWRHTKAPVQGGGAGLAGGYIVIDQPLMEWGGGELGMFLQYGLAQRSAESIKNYIGGGLHISGLIPGRGDDEAGIAVARADFSSNYRTINPGFKKAETVIELTYRAQLFDWLAIQPAFQYIISPSGDPALANAKVGILRAEIGI
ncbi:porin [Mariprofundus ferrinatatus]|uniref:Porin n=1 Tax=Mariprofundus ferrinatatus TaxID=1921087 RepID=A0A2K8L116_9PROT|nr:carbohydrate porin [Mariprofundus ferrinatatus]ATX80933.1 porin [Mariprofundus ferrinatatus]